VCAASYAVAIIDLMCRCPTVQKPNADSWRSLGCFVLDYYTLIRPGGSEFSREADYGLKAKLSAVGNMFSPHME